MGFLNKEPYECKMLEAYRIDIEKTNNIYKANNPSGKSELGTQREYCELIAESNEYNFYSYRTYSDGSGGYVLRQDKQNPMNVVYFGDCKMHNCVFHGYLFQVNRSGEIGRFGITGKNIQTGEIRNFSWLSDKANAYVINGFGRFYCQDSVNKVFIKEGKLIFKITRKKSDYSPKEDNKNSKYDVDTDYDLVISYAEGKLKATAVYPANIGKTSKSSNQCLGRDVSKQLRCEYKGHEKDCSKKCEKCAIHIKDTADIALSKNRFDEAIALYKKAAFIEPHYADAWVSLGGIYKDKSEYKKALDAFERAIAIDKMYGEAIFGKAIVLQKLGHLEEALNVTKDLLSMYNNPEVISFKKELIDLGAKDVLRIDGAIEIMTNRAREIASENDLLDENGKIRTEKAIYKKNEFATQIFDYCKKKYASLGEEKVRSESIITSFYSSLCTTLFYYKDKDGFINIHPFEYIKDHIDLEKTDVTAERMLEMKSDDAEAEALWNTIYDYAQFSGNIISKVDADDVEAAIIDATESAYVLGMLYAMRSVREKTSTGRESIDAALEKLAESSKDYVNPPRESAMCYSISIPDEVEIRYQCNNCGKTAILKVWEGEENLIENYRKLTSKFAELGHKTDVLCYCDECASFLFPSDSKWSTNNIVFSFLANGLNTPNYSNISNLPVYSFPSTRRYGDFEYEVALSFLKGADTIEKLSEDTGTKLDAEVYLKHVRNVIGSTDI